MRVGDKASNARMDCVAREKGDEWNAGNRVTARDFYCTRRASFVCRAVRLPPTSYRGIADNEASVSRILAFARETFFGDDAVSTTHNRVKDA